MVSSCKNDKVDWLMVYVAEAHATDVWPIRSSRCNGDRGPVNIATHKDDTARALAGARFVDDFEMTFRLFVDPLPSEEFEKNYAPWPVRLYCLENDKLSYISEPENGEVPIERLMGWLMEKGVMS